MRSGFILFLVTVPLLWGQTPPPAPVNASITGIVRDKTTGAPVKDYTVSTFVNATYTGNAINMTADTKRVSSKTDASGRFRLSDLPPAEYRLQAAGPEGAFAGIVTRSVTLAGQDLEGINFEVSVLGIITGRVLDENKDPQPGMMVRLVSKDYFQGSAGYHFAGSSITNDLGEYILPNVTPGRNYYLETDKFRTRIPVHADTPLSAKMRRRVPMRTWYPSSPDKEGAAPVIIRPGETRPGVDIEVKKTPSYCISGIALTPNGPTAMNLSIEQMAPSSGVSGSGGMFFATPYLTTADDGKFRVCDLGPGSYRATIQDLKTQQEPPIGINIVTISEEDLIDLRFTTTPRASLKAEVALDGTPPQTPLTVKARVGLRPMFRTQMPGEKTYARPDIPATEELTGLLYDDYAVDAAVAAPGLYVKDVTYGGRSVLYEPLRLGSSGDSTMRVVIGQDGATVSAKVTGKNGAPIQGSTVIVIPQGTASEGGLAARLVSGQTNQAGVYKSVTLPPGKYYVVATEDSLDMTPESIGKLWQSHNRYQELSLEAGGSPQVDLQPLSIR